MPKKYWSQSEINAWRAPFNRTHNFRAISTGDMTISEQVANIDLFVLTRANENRTALRNAGYTGRFIQYIKGDAIHDPNRVFDTSTTVTTTQPYRNNVAWKKGDAEDIKAANAWPLRKTTGNGYVLETISLGKMVYCDCTHQGFKNFFRDRLHEYWDTADGDDWDAVWYDNCHIYFTGASGTITPTVQYGNSGDSQNVRNIKKDWWAWGRDTIANPYGRYLGGNLQGEDLTKWKELVPSFDHVFIEFFALGFNADGPKSHNDWKRDIDKAEDALRHGIETFCAGHFSGSLANSGNSTELARMRYAVRSMLLIAAPLAALRLGTDYGSAFHFDEVDDVQALGAPLDRYYLHAAGVYRREFWNGMVEVNTNTGTSSMTVGGSTGINPPWYTVQTNRTNATGIALDIPFYCKASNGGTLTFSATGLPTGLSINSSTGRITGTPTVGGGTVSNVTLQVSETSGAGTRASTTDFDWTITGASSFTPDVIRVNVGGAEIAASGSDPVTTAWAADPGSATFTNTNTVTNATATNVPTYATGTPTTIPTTVGRNYKFSATAVGSHMSWAFNVGDNNLRDVLLLFNETSSTTRTFDILINGAVVLDNYNIYTEGGSAFDRIVAETIEDVTPSSNVITIRAEPQSSTAARLSGIQISTTDSNAAPVLAAIGAKSVDEGAALTFDLSATDADTDPLLYSVTGLPTGASFIDFEDGTARFSWVPSYTQAGVHNVTFTVSDGTLTDFETVAITVNEALRAPTFDTIADVISLENELIEIEISTTNGEGNPVEITAVAEDLISGMLLTDNGDGTALFEWIPDYTQSGVFSVEFTVTDTVTDLFDTEVVQFTITNVDRAPVLASIGNRSAAENGLLTFTISASDPDGTIPTFSATSLPSGATLTDNEDGTATFSWIPDYSQFGLYYPTFIATASGLTDSEQITIQVFNANRPPVLDAIGDKETDEGELLTFLVTASDPDGDATPVMTATGLPTGASYTDHGNGTATFTWTPTNAQSGTHTPTFIATTNGITDTEQITITVVNVGVPTLNAIGNKSVNENALLTFEVTASAGSVLTTSALPTGANFVDNGDGTGDFSWTPSFSQSGEHDITFTATTAGGSDNETITITVANVQRPPVLASIGAKSGNENEPISFFVTASDPDGDAITLSATGLPTGANFTDLLNGTGAFSWLPGYSDSGTHNVTFTATSAGGTDDEVVVFTITNVQRPPVLAAISSRSVAENTVLSFNISAVDPDGDAVTLTVDDLPVGADFTDNGGGSGTFEWTPVNGDIGVHVLTFIATSTGGTSERVMSITVLSAPDLETSLLRKRQSGKKLLTILQMRRR